MKRQINPAKLMRSKWTAKAPLNKEKHFIVTQLIRSQDDLIVGCEIEAVLTNTRYQLDWRELQNPDKWKQGWC